MTGPRPTATDPGPAPRPANGPPPGPANGPPPGPASEPARRPASGRPDCFRSLRTRIRSSALITAGHLVAAQLAVAASGLVINALAARSMGPAGRGGLALLLQLAYLVNMLAMAGTDRAYPATVPLRRGVTGATIDAGRLVVPSGIVVLAASAPIVYVVGGDISDRGILTLAAFVIAASAMITGAVLRTGAAASGIARPYVVSTVAGQLVLIAVVGVLTARGVASPAVWLLGYAVSLSTVPVVAWVALRRRRAKAGAEDGAPQDLGPARRLGLRLLPAGLASMVMLRADRLLLPWLGSYEQLGLYVVVATVTELVTWPVQSYVDAQAPRWHHRFLTGELRRARPLLGAAAYGLVAGAGLLTAGQLLVVPVFGEEYGESVALLTPLAAASVCYSVSRVAVGLGVAAGRARGALLADIPAMVVALVTYLALIPRYGALGAAVGSAIAYGLGAVLAIGACAVTSRGGPAAGVRRGPVDDASVPHQRPTAALLPRRRTEPWPRTETWPQTEPRRRPYFWAALMTAFFLVALAGRFSFERAGLTSFDIADPRIPAYGLLLAAALFWLIGQPRSGTRPPWPRVFLVFTLLIASQLTSALWAPSGARLEKAAWDLIALWILVLVATMLAVSDPRRAARTVLVLMLAVATVYAIGALFAGPQAQGRYSAFGSGPNVFVRVVSLGVIASIALAAVQRKWWLLLPAPLLTAAAVLSGSRGGLAALFGAGTIFFVFFARRRITVLLCALLIGGAGSWASYHLAGRWFTTVVKNRYSAEGLQRGDFSVRPEFLSAARRIFLDHPITGAGLDSFYVTVGFDYPHNYLAGLAVETGLVAVLLAGIAATCWWWQGRPWKSAPREQIACGVAAGYILIASMFSGDHFDTRFFWILAVIAVLRPGPAPEPAPDYRPRRQPGTNPRPRTNPRSRDQPRTDSRPRHQPAPNRADTEVTPWQTAVRRHAGSSS